MRQRIIERWEKLEEKRQAAMSGGGIAYDAVRVQMPHSGGMPKVEDLVDAEGGLKEMVSRYKRRVWMIKAVITDTAVDDPVSADFLRLRYLQELPLKDVAEAIGYTERHVYRLRKRALKAFNIHYFSRIKRCHTMSG